MPLLLPLSMVVAVAVVVVMVAILDVTTCLVSPALLWSPVYIFFVLEGQLACCDSR